MFKAIKRWFARPKNPAGNVYYARLKTPTGTYYKIGYTSKSSLFERFAYGGQGDEFMLDREFFFTFHPNAWDIEQTLLEHFDKHRAFGRYSNQPQFPLSGRGQSELFKLDVLGLDEELYRRPVQFPEAPATSTHDVQTNGCMFVLLGLALAPFTLGLSLLFIVGGGLDFFSPRHGAQAATARHPTVALRRPEHPPEIRKLLATLTKGCFDVSNDPAAELKR